MKNPLTIYTKRRDRYYGLLEKQTRAMDRLANIRLIIVLMGIGNIVLLYRAKSYYFIYYILLAYGGIFTWLVVSHNRMKVRKKYLEALYQINQEGIERIEGRWKDFEDRGQEFLDESHGFSNDLDIFGQGSLFQYINATRTSFGRRSLAKYLSQTAGTRRQIEDRQEAIEELAHKLAWRQRFMAEGLILEDKVDKKDKLKDEEDLYKFFERRYHSYTSPWIKIGVRLLPIITIAMGLLYLFKLLPPYLPITLLIIQACILRIKSKERSIYLNLVYKHEKTIKLYSKMLYQIEKANFESDYLLEVKARLVDKSGNPAHSQIGELERISDHILNRNNPYFMIVNILTLWDYQCMINLEKWKQESGHLIRSWIEGLGDFEALSSLANINHDKPDWATPNIRDRAPHIRARHMGHPLLRDGRVCNDLIIDDPTKALLITGSNMSGKSTYLRTVGINLVLAYAGSKVCAREFDCQIFNIYSCMRVSDSLDKNTSSFYAELVRIKRIVDQSKKDRVFFLLDEVFKGTNSEDRHEGARILIKNLINNQAIGLVSSHDLELKILEEESKGKVKNYHFKEYYKDNKIYFDYKINPGVSTTKNAMYLIRMMGIEMEE